jgi:5-methylcytosine-specific restriction endonuclease McrA
MAKNTTNKRIAIKHIRDRCKAKYQKRDTCDICGTDKDLELHHFHSLTKLLNSWAEKKNYSIDTDEEVLEIRDEFIAEHHHEIYDLVATLCNSHHVKLHSCYGKAPSPSSVEKQQRWIELQKNKLLGIETAVDIQPISRPIIGSFTKFIDELPNFRKFI